jgi:hypothetical protein
MINFNAYPKDYLLNVLKLGELKEEIKVFLLKRPLISRRQLAAIYKAPDVSFIRWVDHGLQNLPYSSLLKLVDGLRLYGFQPKVSPDMDLIILSIVLNYEFKDKSPCQKPRDSLLNHFCRAKLRAMKPPKKAKLWKLLNFEGKFQAQKRFKGLFRGFSLT